MLRPFCNIKIAKNEFSFVTEGLFSSSWKIFTDTGSITLPHRLKKDGKTILIGENNFFNKGDFVSIDGGYFPKLENIFEGYISAIKPTIPVQIKLEDAAWLLKQNNLTLSYKSVTLKELLSGALDEAKNKATGFVLDGLKNIKLEVVDAKLGAFRLTNVNITNILQELKKTYALRSYFRGHTLYVGLAYYGDGKRHILEFGKDIIDDGTDLEYLKEDDVTFKVKAVSMLENNTKIEIEVGDPNGEQRTITKYNLQKKELKEIATREIERLRYEGFRGKIKTFLFDVVKHGDEIEIIDKRIPERQGIYLAEAIEVQIGINGYFQVIKLGAKVG